MTDDPLSRQKVEAHLADNVAGLAAQRQLVEAIERMLTTAKHHLRVLEGQDAAFRRLAEQRGLVDEPQSAAVAEAVKGWLARRERGWSSSYPGLAETVQVALGERAPLSDDEWAALAGE